MIALLLVAILIAIVGGKAGFAFIKGLLVLSFGVILLMAGCAIV